MTEKESKRERWGWGVNVTVHHQNRKQKLQTAALIVTAWTQAIVLEEGEGVECHCPLSKP